MPLAALESTHDVSLMKSMKRVLYINKYKNIYKKKKTCQVGVDQDVEQLELTHYFWQYKILQSSRKSSLGVS